MEFNSGEDIKKILGAVTYQCSGFSLLCFSFLKKKVLDGNSLLKHNERF